MFGRNTHKLLRRAYGISKNNLKIQDRPFFMKHFSSTLGSTQICKNYSLFSKNKINLGAIRLVTTETKLQDNVQESPDELYRALDVYIKGHDEAVLDSYATFAKLAAEELGIHVADVITPKKVIDRYTLLRSVHIHKKHRVQYELRTNKKVIRLKHLTKCTADVFLSYIQINIPAGVAMEVHKWLIDSLPKAIQQDMIKKGNELTNEDRKLNEEIKIKKPFSRESENQDYEEINVTKNYILGAHK